MTSGTYGAYRIPYADFKDYVPSDDTTVHINHKNCPAGEDVRGRLYITRMGGNTLVYCHNCGGRAVYIGKFSVPNLRAEKHKLGISPKLENIGDSTVGTMRNSVEWDFFYPSLFSSPANNFDPSKPPDNEEEQWSLAHMFSFNLDESKHRGRVVGKDGVLVTSWWPQIYEFLVENGYYYIPGWGMACMPPEVGGRAPWMWHKKWAHVTGNPATSQRMRASSPYSEYMASPTRKSQMFRLPSTSPGMSPIFRPKQLAAPCYDNILFLTEDLLSAQVLAHFGMVAMPLFGTKLPETVAVKIAARFPYVAVWFDDDNDQVRKDANATKRTLELYGCTVTALTGQPDWPFLPFVIPATTNGVTAKKDPKRGFITLSNTQLTGEALEERAEQAFGPEVLEISERG